MDFRGDSFQGPLELLSDPQTCWPQQVLAMNLARVGSDIGPDLGLIARLTDWHRTARCTPPVASDPSPTWNRCHVRAAPVLCSPARCTTGASGRPSCASSIRWIDTNHYMTVSDGRLPPETESSVYLCAANGCPMVLFLATTSLALGSPATARLMDSLVAA